MHSYFTADPLLAKLREQVAELRRLGAAVAADDLIEIGRASCRERV